jgi:hypothetical protein
MKVLNGNLRLISLCGALLLYAFASSPTPDNPGLIEACIGFGLAIACAPSIMGLIQSSLTFRTLWQSAGTLLLLYGLTICICLTLLNGQSITNALRDILPFLYLFLPLFVTGLFYNQPQRARILIIIAVCMGFVFAIRSLSDILTTIGYIFTNTDELYYLANSPLVLVSACIGVYGLFYNATNRIDIKSLTITLGFAVITLAGFAAMAMTLQRASLAFLALYTNVIAIIFVIKRPLRALPLVAIIFLLLMPFAKDFIDIIDALVQKTQAHGMNNRTQEWAAVWNEASQSWPRLMFGGGWGTTFESPAVSGVSVNFTHSLLSAMILKTGLAGLLLTLLYLAGLGQMLMALIRRDLIMGLAILGPFLIDILLYGSYKSLDFGILLLLIPVTLLSRYAINTKCKDTP